MEVFYKRHDRVFTLDTDELENLDYLLQYGFAQSMQDCVAGVAGKVWEELAEKARDDLKIVPADKTKPFAEFRAFLARKDKAEYAATFAELHAATTRTTEIALLEKRESAILEGKVGSRAGGGDGAIEVEMRRLAMPLLPAYCRAKGFAVPKDKDVKRELLMTYVALNDAALRKQATANIAAKLELEKALAASIGTPKA